ncbi:hypothetical protein AB0C34_17555 [Nocardia sp. NPDC049220]|uniref:hypothetical protein n=1 Tax=Nocardia sp. NPDC049220 TaxID=3155273 RepID=UPI0033FE7E8D
MSDHASLAECISEYKRARTLMQTVLVDSVSRLGFHPQDVEDAGGSDRQVRTARELPLTIGATDAYLVGGRPIGQLESTSVVALVASNTRVGAPLWHEHGIYLRDHALNKPVRRIADALGTDRDHQISDVRPILARYFLGSAAAVPPHHPSPVVAHRLAVICPLLTSPDMIELWPGPCDLFILGEAVPINLPLGYSRPTGLPGTQHHRLGDLQTATALKGTPTV